MKLKIIFFMFLFFIISVSIQARTVVLTWDANKEPDLDHYIVYYGTLSGNYSDNSGDIGLITEYSVEIPDDGQIYYFAVTAVDTAGFESDFSNEVNTNRESIDEYLYLPPVAPKNNKRAMYQETLTDGSIAVYIGSNITVKKIDGTEIIIQQ